MLEFQPALSLQQPGVAPLRSAPQQRRPAGTIAACLHAQRYQSRRSPRRLPCPPLIFRDPLSPSHSIPQSPHAVCSQRLPAPRRPATAPPWNPLVATTPLAGFLSVLGSAVVAWCTNAEEPHPSPPQSPAPPPSGRASAVPRLAETPPDRAAPLRTDTQGQSEPQMQRATQASQPVAR